MGMKKMVGVMLIACFGAAGMAGTVSAKNKGKDADDDVSGATRMQYNCELGKKVTVFHKAEEQDSITLQWNNKKHVLTREATTTGAHRFEDKKAGLVWINIPAKSILLDSKQGRQLANECRT